MNDEDLRDFFAAFAMISKAWIPEHVDDHAAMCYELADAMIAARKRMPDEGIAAVIKKRRKTKEA